MYMHACSVACCVFGCVDRCLCVRVVQVWMGCEWMSVCLCECGQCVCVNMCLGACGVHVYVGGWECVRV